VRGKDGTMRGEKGDGESGGRGEWGKWRVGDGVMRVKEDYGVPWRKHLQGIFLTDSFIILGYFAVGPG